MPETPIHLKAQTLSRAPSERSDEALGVRLSSLVVGALHKHGKAPAMGVLVRPGRVDLLPLGPVAAAGQPLGLFLAGLTRARLPEGGLVEAVGLIGTLSRTHRASGRTEPPVAMVFLEWGDCRWWQWRGLLDAAAGGGLVDDAVFTNRAVDGDPKPPALGGWWSLGRRRNLHTRLTPRVPAVEEHTQVH